MRAPLTVLSCAAALCLASHAADAAKPVRPVSLSQINAAPRGVPVPLAGVGLPALVVLGVVGWRRMRRREKRDDGSRD